ncbi:DUF1549 and DUF1553 domain-containing protein [Tautonia plasticadhaerens]|uniref:Cytochrome c domain-containing protein n=1 Tax=Tautonia plasticadhaerens TaxID=2527974 RepID=A0A518GZZ6_9BACT|nr:DUF1549 and DUF1553 domain-containing protein [Tautonia plasticadhaerens]QDV34158.1 hypothetical protein ElP_20410 [Tautonia plasticadhaerens]
MTTSRLVRSMSPGGRLPASLAAALALGLGASSPADEGPADPPTSAVDRLVREGWEAAGVSPSSLAPDGEFLRRAYLDLVGRIPSLEEARGFLDGSDPGKRAKLVSYLLDHPDYARHFGNLWSVALIGRGDQGNSVDRPALRAWLRTQFAANKPWDEIARELITATGPNTAENGATNFAMAHLEFDAVPLTSVTTRVFLGQQIQCTQCHDHPSNDWKQADFWGINAFFRGVRTREVGRVGAGGAEETAYYELFDDPTDAFARFDRRDGTIRIAFPTYLDGRKISQGTDADRRKELGTFVTEPGNDQFARAFVNRMWGHLMGRGIVHPIDDFGDHNPPSNPELLDHLAADFEASGYDIKQLIRRITSSRAYHLSSVRTPDNERDETYFSHMALKPLTPEQLFESLLTATQAHQSGAGGDSDARRDRWLRQFTFTFSNDEVNEGTSFQGTIPQALMMMNGDLITEATSCTPGSFLKDLLDEARRRGASADFVVDRLYLAALSRPPSSTEAAAAQAMLRQGPDGVAVMEDIFWALLNSNEFVLNH